jgi:diadenylate cyclase
MFAFVEKIKTDFMNNIWNKMGEQWGAFTLQLITFVLLYYIVFKVLKENKAGKIIAIFTCAIIMFGLAFGLSVNIDTQMLLMVIIVASLMVITMYDTEIKRGLMDSFSKKKTKHGDLTVSHIETIIDATIRAVQHLSKNDIGALIVLSNDNLPESVVSSGTIINADINAPMIEAVFYPKAPLHDGAMIIEGDKIHAAGCFLPLIQDDTLPQEVGSRHRAALGITAVASVTSIVVSEETGIISIVRDGQIKKRYASDTDLRNALSDYYWSDLTAGGN